MHLNDESTTTCLDNNKKSTDSQTTINSNNNNSGHSGDNDSLIIQPSSDYNNNNNTNPDTNQSNQDDLLLTPGSSSDYPCNGNLKLTNPINLNSSNLDDQLIVNKSLTVSIDDGSQQNPTNLPINPNDISIMQDSTDLHWFNEETYQSEKTHLIENMPIISESSTNTESINRTTGGNHYHQNRYHVLSRNIDATLAEIDMETFTSEDINHIYSTLPELDSSCSADDGGGGDGTVTEDGGEEFASVTGSLLDEIHSDSHYLSSKRFNSRGIDLNGSSSIFDSSLIVGESSVKTLSSGGCGGGGDTLTMRSERFPGLYERSHLDVSGVSADSLDFSSSENDNNTNEMILRCREQDKTKYTIAFEESVSSVTTFSDSADDIKNNSEESDTVTHFNHHHHHHRHHYNNSNTNKCNHQQRRRRMNAVNFISVNNNPDDGDDDDYDLEDDYHRHHNDDNDLVKSEYTTWNMVKRRGPISRRELIRLRRYPFRTIAKQSQSLPNIVQVTSILTGDHGEPLFPPLGSYVPLYDLNKSNTTTNSSNSEVSPPRSLIKLFIKNRTSPTSSSPGSSSTSFEGHLIESSELTHGNHHNHHHQGQQSTLSGGGGGLGKGFTRSGSGPNGQYYFGDKEGNLKVAFNDKRNVGQQCVNEDWNNFEDSLMGEGVTGNGTDTVGGHVTLLPPKNGFNRLKQASPIREEDITSDTSRGDEAVNSGTDESYHGKDGKLTDRHWPIYHFDKFKSNTNNGNNNNDRVNVIGARRSISVDRFMSTQCTGGSGCGGDTDGIGIRGGGPSSTGGGTSNNPNNNIRRSSDYGSTNMNKIRFSSGREFGSVSSGYLSSRQGSSEWHRKTAFTHHPPSFQHHHQQQQQQPKPSSSSSSLPHQYPLNPSSSSSSIPSKRYSISVTTMRTASTQVPVHIQDKQVQTGINCQLGGGNGGDNEHQESTYPSMKFIVREYPTSTVREKSIPLSSCYAKETFSPSLDYHNYQNHEPQDESQRAKPLYVCFPNYSLPDLSFLRTLSCPCTPKEEGPSAVYLSPTKLKLPLREFKSNVGIGNVGGIRRPFGRGKGVRPKSCTDYENLIANRSFNHIKDWDSLKVLLPNEFKSLIARLEGGNGDSNQPEESTTNQDGGSRKSKESDVNDKRTSEKSTTINNTNPFSSNYKEPKTMTSPLSEVKLRPRKRSVRTLDGYKGPSEVNEGACGCHQERKRHSLQEPPSDYGHHHNHPPSRHHHHPNNFHHHETNDPINCTYRNTISRSVTMPSCVCNSQQPVCHLNCCQPHNYYQQNHFHPHDHHLYSQQQQQQHNPHFHHVTQNSPVTGINSCCQGVTGIGGGAGKSSMSSNVKPNEINSSLVNGLFDDPSVDRLCHLLSKGISVKDFTNIIGGVGTPGNTMNSGGNGIGINHKNRLPSPSKPYEPIKEQVIEETDSMCISSKGGGGRANTNHLPGSNNQQQQLNTNNDNNRITKGEDESKINSNFNVIKKRWESLASPVSSTINSPEPNLPIANTIITGKGKSSPTPPRSTTPPTPSSNYSSPAPSSSSTTTSSSALLVKPKVPIKPPLSSLRPTSVPIAKRPTTLGANNSAYVFKSMIPIAKGSKSPPNVKQLTSPISKTLPRTNSRKSSTTNKTT